MQLLALSLVLFLTINLFVCFLISRPDRISIVDRIALALAVLLLPISFVLGILQLFGVVPEVALFMS